ncbi:DUF2752 domain-containing protein [Aequorivita marina]|uniref:DUF2752 domain-containing protein n=1 Tax=Aequorivita marina TaxID=3073654 RepID=UPI00287491C7|nr:DUF2752 domain-containing protein [Aequorivita sp. S2608]MDS1297522.1 DUF2752 domain-containing protein [Aequorivita sp. S2608]
MSFFAILVNFEKYMIPCVNKKIFGVECLGCGMQRGAVHLLSGEFAAAFKVYPAIYSISVLLAVVFFNFFVKFKFDYQIKIALIILNAIIMVVSYFIKMSHFT